MKFETPRDAQEARKAAAEMGMPAEIARTRMNRLQNFTQTLRMAILSVVLLLAACRLRLPLCSLSFRGRLAGGFWASSRLPSAVIVRLCGRLLGQHFVRRVNQLWGIERSLDVLADLRADLLDDV